MKRVRQTAIVLAGMLFTAVYAMPQAYTVSAKPGAVNDVEGHVFLNAKPLPEKGLRSVFLNTNDTLSSDIGKAEVLLTPGVFLRIGDNTQIRMISPSLVDTQIEVKRGEAMIEADGLLKDNHVTVIDHGATITVDRNGLYRFTADPEPKAAAIDGRLEVFLGEKKFELGKGHELVLADAAKPEKFDAKAEDDLYAWSNVRAQYDAASSYQAANSLVSNNNYGGWGGYGFGGWYSPGWYWNSAFNGYGWVPGDGAFFSPFGWGFYGGGYLPYAPVVVTPVGGWHNGHWTGGGTRTTIPVNPNHPPAVGLVTASPAANNVARAAAAQSFSYSGFRTASGVPAGSFSGSRGASAAARGASAGAWSGGHVGGTSAPMSAGGGGHVGGGGGGAGHR